jgi:hypothetical protein
MASTGNISFAYGLEAAGSGNIDPDILTTYTSDSGVGFVAWGILWLRKLTAARC